MSFDAPADNAAFRAKYSFPFALLSDASRAMAIAYGAADDAKAEYPRRAACVVDAQGRVLAWHAKVDARAFPEAVLRTLPEPR